jgi:hypothetical protein
MKYQNLVIPSSQDVRQTLARSVSLATIIACGSQATGQVINATFDSPTLDRWFYPFASNPGNESSISIFGSVTKGVFDPMFDNRDGQGLIGFDTSRQIAAGLGPANYSITSAVVELMVSNDVAFSYDPTVDPHTTWLMPDNPDFTEDDAGRPVELFGAGFRNGYTASTFPEDGPYSPVGPFGKAVRNVYPVTFDQDAAAVDASNNVDELFSPVPWAIGLNEALVQGEPVPQGTVLMFEINVSDQNIQQSLRESLDEGMLDLVVASIFEAVQQQGGTFPRFYTKEDALVKLGIASAATLSLTVEIADTTTCPADIAPVGSGDGTVGPADLGELLANWGPCDPGPCPADLFPSDVGDGIVGAGDLGELLANWGQCGESQKR